MAEMCAQWHCGCHDASSPGKWVDCPKKEAKCELGFETQVVILQVDHGAGDLGSV